MRIFKHLIVIPALAAVLLVLPADKPAVAGGGFGITFSYGVPFFDPGPSYSPYSYDIGAAYGWWDDRPYGDWGHRHDHRFNRRHSPPRHDRRYGRDHHDRHDHGHRRGYRRW